jgi:ABC-type transport system substrate-binding protein
MTTGYGWSFRDGDWPRLRQIIQKLSSQIIGPTSTPVFSGVKFADGTTISAADVARWNMPRLDELAQNEATTVLIGPLFDWGDSKTLLFDALGGNDNFDPDTVVITLFKGTTATVLSDVAKTGGTNNINLVNAGMATLSLTAANVDTAGPLTIALTNATAGGEVLFPKISKFCVV